MVCVNAESNVTWRRVVPGKHFFLGTATSNFWGTPIVGHAHMLCTCDVGPQ